MPSFDHNCIRRGCSTALALAAAIGLAALPGQAQAQQSPAAGAAQTQPAPPEAQSQAPPEAQAQAQQSQQPQQQPASDVDTSVSSGGPSVVVVSPAYAAFRFDPSLAAKLSPTATAVLDGCNVHLPLGYAPEAGLTMTLGLKLQVFKSLSGPDGSFAQFSVIATDIKPGSYDMDALLGRFLTMVTGKLMQTSRDFTATQVEYGLVSGIPFARTYYKYTQEVAPGLWRPMRGFTYDCFDQRHSVLLAVNGDDDITNGAKSMPVEEASALTFLTH